MARQIAHTYGRDYGATIHFVGDPPPIDPNNPSVNEDVWHILHELINNCVGNRIPGSSLGATEITATFNSGRLTVEDNFTYTNPEEVLERILQIRDSGRPMTTRARDPKDESLFGGAGIAGTILRLKKYGGKLDYRIQDGTIVAEITWNS